MTYALPMNAAALLPQKPPFVLIGELIVSEESKIITETVLTAENIFYDKGYFLATGMIENIAQTVAAGRGFDGMKNNHPPQIGFIGNVKNVQIHFLPPIPSTIRTEVEIISNVLNFTSVKGCLYCKGKLAAECELVIAVQES